MNTETLETIFVKSILILAYPIAIIEAHYSYFMGQTDYTYKGEVKRLHRDWVEAWEELSK